MGEITNHARVILVNPRDLKSWVDGINEMVRTAEAVLTNGGFIIINDEGENHGKLVVSATAYRRAGFGVHHQKETVNDTDRAILAAI